MTTTKTKIDTKLRNLHIHDHIKKNTIVTDHPKFSSVKSLAYLKENVYQFIVNALKSDEFKKYNAEPPRSVLIYGSKGVGKRFLIKSVCSEYKIPLIVDDDIESAIRKAKICKPSIILIDLDNPKEKEIVKFLAKNLINGDSDNFDVLVVGVVNNKMKLSDETISFFENEIFVKMPTRKNRVEILRMMIENLKTENIDFETLATNTPGFLPQDLKKLVKMATTKAVYHKAESVNMSCFEEALDQMRDRSKMSVTFDEIGALESIKRELEMSIIFPALHKDKFLRMGINKPSGVLLYGPPGCGKTMLARAVASHLHFNFLAIKGPELINKYVGDSEKHIREIFERAKYLQPCILFFDEIDSLVTHRNDDFFSVRIVNQMLSMIDGIESRGEVYLMGATNRIEALDKAILRPGRFDKIIHVPLPDKLGRKDIFMKCIKNVPVEDFDYELLDMDGFSGAEISGVVRDSILSSLNENFEENNLVVRFEHFKRACEKMRNRMEFE
ncbi:ATPase family protein 2 like protein [Dictyocoela muelleri]|nr:ATPase family protein 2 like protein [Dictyocoela muelleri]